MGLGSWERRLQPPSGAEPLLAWSDSYRLLLAAARHGPPVVVATEISFHPSLGRAVFRAVVFDEGPLVIVDSDGAIPIRGWEVRSSGLWVDQNCETPLDHWSFNLEAFALAIDQPDELLGRGLGDRVPLGWELEFEASEPALHGDDGGVRGRGRGQGHGNELRAEAGAYHQLGVAHGLVLIGDREIELEGRAWRSHRWGPYRSRPDAVLADGFVDDEGKIAVPAAAALATAVALPGPLDVWWVTPTVAGVRTTTEALPPAD